MTGIKPVRITVLSPGTFKKYTAEKIASGADLAQCKPHHINPPQEAMETLLSLSGKIGRMGEQTNEE